jgi:hypothetical protein
LKAQSDRHKLNREEVRLVVICALELGAGFLVLPVKPALFSKNLECMALLADVAHAFKKQAYLFKCSG